MARWTLSPDCQIKCPWHRAVLAVLAVGLLLPVQVLAASDLDDRIGEYRGFSLSDRDPRNHPFMTLTVTRNDGADFFGVVETGAPGGAPAGLKGKITDSLGHFKGQAINEFVNVKFDGIIQSLGDQKGLLVVASYKLTASDGSQDQGTTRLLRSFELPPGPCFPPEPCITPPDVTGDWSGTAMSNLTGELLTVQLEITGQDGDRPGSYAVPVGPQFWWAHLDRHDLAGEQLGPRTRL